jgi:uncharacterized OB-fold protein
VTTPAGDAVVAACDLAGGSQGLADQYQALLAEHGTPLVQRCGECASAYFPPLLSCRSCHSGDLAWVGAGRHGRVGTFVTVHTRDATPSMSIPRRLLDEVPYTSVYVEPEGAPHVRIPALMVGAWQHSLAVCDRVELAVPGPGPIRATRVEAEGEQ